ncbi:hypothetical protein QFZ97_001288 [Paraburkholderia youngii]
MDPLPYTLPWRAVNSRELVKGELPSTEKEIK